MFLILAVPCLPSELKPSLDACVEFMDMLELWLCVSCGTGVTVLLPFVLDSRFVEASWL